MLEQLRLLTNLETNTKKLLQVILIGQPELQQLLQRRDLRQLAQRITARYHLLPLNKQEVAQYLKHRLSVAKCFREIFDKSAVNAIHKTCKGIPRLMNLLAERSLMNAYNSNNAVVNRKIVLQAAYDALGDEFEVLPWWKNRFVKVGGLVSTLGIVLVIGVWWGTYQLQGGQSALHLTAAENEADIKVAKTVTQEKTISVVDNNANALVQNTVVDTQALINEKTVSDNETVFSNNNIGSTKLVDTAKQQLLATNKKILAAEKKLASLQVAQQQSADDFIEPEKKVTPKNFVVEAEAGVSDALLASFQSAIEETKQDEQTIEKPVVENSDLIPLTQMPVWVQDGVPSIAFEMHIYASDGQGWVRVNGRDRYEGDYIGRELLLNEILPQKVVLSFRGEKFTMGALTSWN